LQTLLNNYPVGVLIFADSGFISYSSGVYSGCPSFATSYYYINHAVTLIGYDSNGNWIIKNQWSTNWGENGFARISRSNNCALNAWVYQFYSSTPYSGTTDFNVSKFFDTKYQNNFTSILLLAILLIIGIML
jgi:C1A family cysteine protease